jgi:hypothetical protein
LRCIVRDFRLWWGLFVFFGVLSVLVVQRGYRRWHRMRAALAADTGLNRAALDRRLRREGWRLAWMALSVISMTALVFAALLGAPKAAILTLRVVAMGAVAVVVWLSVSR